MTAQEKAQSLFDQMYSQCTMLPRVKYPVIDQADKEQLVEMTRMAAIVVCMNIILELKRMSEMSDQIEWYYRDVMHFLHKVNAPSR